MPAPLGRVLIDARPINHPTARQRGIGRYTAGLIRGLSLAGADVVAASASAEERDIVREALPGIDVRVWRPDLVREASDPAAWYVATQLMLHPITLDPVPHAVTESRMATAAVMYDVIPERYPSRYLTIPSARQLSAVRTMLARSLDGLLAISEFAGATAREVLRVADDRVVSIGAGVGAEFAPAAGDPWPRLGRLVALGVSPRRRVVVAVTGGDGRKNTEGLIIAWSLLPESLRASSQLVVACAIGPEVMSHWTRTASDHGLHVGRDVVFTDSVSDDEMVALHQVAQLAVFPSLEEGFGLPVAEAAACECPVICSDTSSLPEVIDLAEALFDPYDVTAMSAAIEWAMIDDLHRGRLVDAARVASTKWTWRATGERAIRALESFAADRTDIDRRPIRRKVALLSPPRRSPSAIGAYSDRIVSSWRDLATTDVEFFADLSGTSDRLAEGEWSSSALGKYRHHYEFDDIVATLGSSSHHLSTALVAENTDCHVWLHEASLAGCYLSAAVNSGSLDWGRSFVASRAETGESFFSLAPADFHERGITMLGPVLRRARSVVVSSHEAAEIVRAVDPNCPPIVVLPLAHPRTDFSSSSRDVPGRRIVSVGWLASNKRAEVLVHVAERADIHVDFVGPIDQQTADHVSDLASRLGVGHRVRILGRLSEHEYHDAIVAARVGVQLRHGAIGQRSAAVADLVARGVPVITNLVDQSSTDNVVVGVDVDDLDDMQAADLVIEASKRLLFDDEHWLDASARARRIASSWTPDEVARTLDEWLRVHGRFERGSVVDAKDVVG